MTSRKRAEPKRTKSQQLDEQIFELCVWQLDLAFQMADKYCELFSPHIISESAPELMDTFKAVVLFEIGKRTHNVEAKKRRATGAKPNTHSARRIKPHTRTFATTATERTRTRIQRAHSTRASVLQSCSHTARSSPSRSTMTDRHRELINIFRDARENPPSADDTFAYVLEVAEMFLDLDMPAKALQLLHDLERYYRSHHPEYFDEGDQQ